MHKFTTKDNTASRKERLKPDEDIMHALLSAFFSYAMMKQHIQKTNVHLSGSNFFYQKKKRMDRTMRLYGLKET